ncbi:hypothetical protein [Arthrobacter sp. zg-Y877]|uniref:hypothetical protein n=1 Tax=Arthrobacter sp. zg-Y877 TaxID=3049074 RepID=UPI0025A3A472|nr:hypothetical protein [Arthrobacter sp. zg-Y877]MDM7991654.1 hypothetical protein [Arthrobacter sp. zg-Y877]
MGPDINTGTAPRETASREMVAEVAATRWLFAATGAGALIGAAWQLAGAGQLPFLPQNFLGTLLVGFGAGILAALLILAAWSLTARSESRLGIRQQRGAMAALAGLAAFCIPFTPDLVFSPVFGAALVLLAIRSRDVRTAAAGVVALAVALALAFSPDFPGSALVLGLVAAAATAVAAQPSAGYSPR